MYVCVYSGDPNTECDKNATKSRLVRGPSDDCIKFRTAGLKASYLGLAVLIARLIPQFRELSLEHPKTFFRRLVGARAARNLNPGNPTHPSTLSGPVTLVFCKFKPTPPKKKKKA